MKKSKYLEPIKHRKYYFKTEMLDEFTKNHTLLEYAQYMEITYNYMCMLVRRDIYTKKPLAYSLSRYAGKNIDYYFESED